LSDGLAILADMIEQARERGERTISGADAFRLYDTYGFPLDLTVDFAAERGFTVDQDGFAEEMEKQRNRARSARQDVDSMKVQGGPLSDFTDKSEFVGYTELITTAKVIGIVHGDALTDQVGEGVTCQVILDKTPFYAESGGQVSDRGTLMADGLVAEVQEVGKAPHGQHVHTVRIAKGLLRLGDTVRAEVDAEKRDDIVKNHTATHLLHKALKEVLGEHANQAGSLVEPERLRFDFSHFGAVTAEQLAEIERRVNEQIWRRIDVDISYKPLTEAKAMGAMALFGEKYGDIVRVVRVGDYSLELCGGCHVRNTGEIGMFKIVSEGGIGSGVRRIEAVTGRGAYLYAESQMQLLKEAAGLLKSQHADVPKRIEHLLNQLKELNREIEMLQSKLSAAEAGSLVDRAKKVGEVTLLAAQVNVANMDSLRDLADRMKQKLGSAVIVLGAANEGKVHLVAAVTPDLVAKGYNAGNIVKEAASRCGGGGGGRPDMAQAGGKDPSKLQEALQAVERMVAGTA